MALVCKIVNNKYLFILLNLVYSVLILKQMPFVGMKENSQFVLFDNIFSNQMGTSTITIC